jgi:hypothetical protein
MSTSVKRISGFVFSALLVAASIVVSAPAASCAQSRLADMAKDKAKKEQKKDLTDRVMKAIKKNIAVAVGKKPISDVDKASISKTLSNEASSLLKEFIDREASGVLPGDEEAVNAIMSSIQPRIDELMTAAVAKTEADKLAGKIAEKEGERNSAAPKPTPEPEIVSVAETVPMAGPSADADWVINNAETWIKTVNRVKTGGDGKTYTVAVSGDITVPGNYDGTFGSAKNLTVVLTGNGTLYFSGSGNLLSVGIGQTVNVAGSLKLTGHGNNSGPVILVDGGTFRMGGSAAVTGNAISDGAGGGVFVRSGSFIMEENSSVSGNLAKGSGGGVFVCDGEFAMYGNAKVTGNEAYNGGGGVYVENGKFVMADSATVSNNTVWLGGGIYIGSAGTFAMRGYATVSGNTAYRQGGGVYFAGKEFTVEENATVSGNTASWQGSNVYAWRAFTKQEGAMTPDNVANIGDGVYFAGKAPPLPVSGGKDK